MGLLDRFRSNRGPSLVGAPPTEPLWSPGELGLAVVGEAYHEDACARAAQSAAGVQLVGVLVPDPGNSYDPNAVAVYVQGELVGWVPREIAGVLQHALTSRLASYGSQLAGRADVTVGACGPSIVVWIDPTPLGLGDDQLRVLPGMDAEMQRLLPRIDEAVAPPSGLDTKARAELTQLEELREQVDADYDRRPDAWPRLERQFRDVAARLDRAGDPAAGAAWLGLARSARFQRGRRADTLAAYTEALRRDPEQVDGWHELLDYLAWSPDVETLMQVLQSAPADVRPKLVPWLLSISRRTDRSGKMPAKDGERLRRSMLEIAERTADRGCLPALYADAGKQASKSNDDEAAFQWWRRAVAVGCTEPQVVDRVSIRLVQDGAFDAAAVMLRSSSARDDVARTVRERLEKRLARCERERSRSVREGPS